MTTHWVYRCYDADDQLVYIGCTSQPMEVRMSGHRTGNPEVFARTVRWTTEEHPDRRSGMQAEAYAIYDEAPLLNRLHNAKRVPGAGSTLVLNRPKDMEAMRRALELVAVQFNPSRRALKAPDG